MRSKFVLLATKLIQVFILVAVTAGPGLAQGGGQRAGFVPYERQQKAASARSQPVYKLADCRDIAATKSMATFPLALGVDSKLVSWCVVHDPSPSHRKTMLAIAWQQGKTSGAVEADAQAHPLDGSEQCKKVEAILPDSTLESLTAVVETVIKLSSDERHKLSVDAMACAVGGNPDHALLDITLAERIDWINGWEQGWRSGWNSGTKAQLADDQKLLDLAGLVVGMSLVNPPVVVQPPQHCQGTTLNLGGGLAATDLNCY